MTWMRAYSRKSKAFPSERAEVGLLRSLRRTEQIRFIVREQKARIRYVHGNPTLSTPAPAPRLYANPPIPAPDVAMPRTRLRLFENHFGRMDVAVMYRNPIPYPKHSPWLRNRCQILVEKDAPSSETNTRIDPIRSVGLVPIFRLDSETTGEIRRAWDIERPPIRAYCSSVASGNVELER